MLRSTTQCLIAILFLCACDAISQAQGVITVRLSYKVILNPSDGNRPTKGDGTQVTDADIDAAITAMNDLSAGYSRGFYFKRIDPVTNVGGKGDVTGPSKYFSIDFRTDPDKQKLKNELEAAAGGGPAYAWNVQAINIYINQGTSGGTCSFPENGQDVVIVGAVSAGAGNTQLHELGHFFNLCHTHGCDGSANDDGIADTLVDSPLWDRDRIAKNSYPDRNYNQLFPWEKQRVDDVMLNLMSYHGTTGGSAVPAGTVSQSRLTEGQLDRWTDTASSTRRDVCDGYTLFVDTNGSGGQGPLGLSANPIRTFNEAIGYAALGAQRGWNVILLLRPGIYSGHPNLDGKVTLRSTRAGGVTITK